MRNRFTKKVKKIETATITAPDAIHPTHTWVM
jgi:hypothetical protein